MTETKPSHAPVGEAQALIARIVNVGRKVSGTASLIERVHRPLTKDERDQFNRLCEWSKEIFDTADRLRDLLARVAERPQEQETAIKQLQRQVKAWREVGEEMGRIISFMSPEQKDDLLPDWFGPRLFDLQVETVGTAAVARVGEATPKGAQVNAQKDYDDLLSWATRTMESVRPVHEPRRPWPDPTPEMLNDPHFEAVWQCIKSWDINVPGVDGDGMYSGATGNHVRAILDALTSQNPPVEPEQK